MPFTLQLSAAQSNPCIPLGQAKNNQIKPKAAMTSQSRSIQRTVLPTTMFNQPRLQNSVIMPK